MSMKIYGYSKSNPDSLIEMEEVTFQADPSSIKAIAEMMLRFVDQQNQGGMEHLHLQDEWSGWNDEMPDVIVHKP